MQQRLKILPQDPIKSIFFNFAAFITTTTILLLVGWYIIDTRRSPRCSCCNWNRLIVRKYMDIQKNYANTHSLWDGHPGHLFKLWWTALSAVYKVHVYLTSVSPLQVCLPWELSALQVCLPYRGVFLKEVSTRQGCLPYRHVYHLEVSDWQGVCLVRHLSNRCVCPAEMSTEVSALERCVYLPSG